MDMRFRGRRLVLLLGMLLISACLYSWPEAVTLSGFDGGTVDEDAAPNDASEDARESDATILVSGHCARFDAGGRFARCFDFDDGGLGAFSTRINVDGGSIYYGDSDASPPFSAAFLVPPNDAAGGALLDITPKPSESATNVELNFDAILDRTEASRGVNLLVIKYGTSVARLRLPAEGTSVQVQEVDPDSSFDVTKTVTAIKAPAVGAAFPPNQWNHVNVKLSSTVPQMEVTVNGVTGVAPLTAAWWKAGVATFSFGIAFPQSLTVGWALRFDNIELFPSPN